MSPPEFHARAQQVLEDVQFLLGGTRRDFARTAEPIEKLAGSGICRSRNPLQLAGQLQLAYVAGPPQEWVVNVI